MTPATARILHLALLVGTVVVVVVLVAASRSIGERPLGDQIFVWPLRIVAVVQFVVLAAVTGVVGGSVARAEGADAWWRSNGPRLIILWAVAEAMTVLGAILYTLSAVLWTLLPVAAGVATLVLQRPSRVVES